MDILGLFQGRGRGGGEDDGGDAGVTPSLLLARSGRAQRRRLRQSRPRQQERGRRLFFFGGVPLDARLHHQVDGVAVLDVVLLEQLGVRERLAL